MYMIHKAENEVCVTVFFDEGLTDADIKKLGDTISHRNEVSRIHRKILLRILHSQPYESYTENWIQVHRIHQKGIYTL